MTTSPPSVGAWAAAAAAESARSVQAQRAASPAPSAGAAAPPTPTLEAFLEAARLADFAAPLRNMGATSIVDLIDLTALDFTRLGMKDLQRRRLKDALARYSIGGSGMAAASPTPSLSDPEPAGQGVGSATASAAEAEAAAPPPAASAGAGRRFEDWDVRHFFFYVCVCLFARSTSHASPSPPLPSPSLLPLPPHQEYENADGYLYYHSRSTGATMWERPSGPHIVLHTLAERAAAFASAAAGVDVQPVPVQHERSLARGSSSSSSSSGMASGGASGATSAGVWERMYSTEPLSVHSSRAPAVLLPSDKVRLELARRAGMSAGMGAAGGAGAQDPASASSAQPLAFSSSEHNHDTSFERRGPLVNAPVHPYVSSRSRSVVEERSLGGAGALGVEGDKESLGQGGRRGYAHSAPLTSLGPGSAVLLAPSQLTPRPTSSAVYRELVTEGSSSSGAPMSASHVYADVLDGLPVMHPATAEVLARSHSVANPRIMGYADRRPDITPRGGLGGAVGRVNSDHVGERVMFTESGSAGVASGRWASGLRPQLYTPSKDTAASPGRVGWEGGGERGGGVESVGYAYKHAAAASQWAGAGSVYDRLCDPRGYTGLHKHRFDTDGRGKGMRGRDDTGTSADMRYIDASFPADVRVKGEDGKVRVIPANSTPWTLELPGYSGFGTARGMGRKGVKGVL